MTPQGFMDYERDVREALVAFPGMEMREAYERFLREIKKQEPQALLSTGDKRLEAAKAAVKGTLRRPCTQEGCGGKQVLQGVCEGCAAGKKGFKTVWECEECLFREYSKIDFYAWFEQLAEKKGAS